MYQTRKESFHLSISQSRSLLISFSYQTRYKESCYKTISTTMDYNVLLVIIVLEAFVVHVIYLNT